MPNTKSLAAAEPAKSGMADTRPRLIQLYQRWRELDGEGNYKAMVLGEARRYEEALVCFEELLTELNPSNRFAWYGKGIAFESLRRVQEAQACYARAAELA